MKTTGLINSHLPSAGDNRLKAPPDAINIKNKVIKLGGSKPSGSAGTLMETGEKGVTHHKITFDSNPSPNTELNSRLSGIQIHHKDYSKQKNESAIEKAVASTSPVKDLSTATRTKIKLSRNSGATSSPVLSQNAMPREQQNYETSPINKSTPSPKQDEKPTVKKFKRTEISWP